MKDSDIRLNKYLANLGFTSRRNIEQILKEKVVSVNGKRVLAPGVRIDPAKDKITVDGVPVNQEKKYIYIIINKPKGVISTAKDELGRKTVLDLVRVKERIYPVGRLDENTTGLLLLTNDGELTNYLTHPRFHTPKTYMVTIADSLSDHKLTILKQGVRLKEEKTLPAEVTILEQNPKRTVFELTIHEGKYHQVRKMIAALKLNLLSLKRVALGPLKLGDLELGESRSLTPQEITSLKQATRK